jgi:very-short-patch-repair endonuclease
VDREIAALARRQYGVVAGHQLAAIGLPQRAVSHRVAAGRLHRVHQGVFSVGHTVLGRSGRWMAAVLACGPDAALSHASAAALWGLQRGEPNIVDVTARRTGRKRPGIRIHRPRRPAETTTHDRIPVTTPARTILDLAAVLTASRLEHLLDQAEIQELTDYRSLDAIARAHPGHHGAAKLQRATRTHYAGTDLTRSELEILFKQLCRDHGLPAPRVNAQIAGLEVDFHFPHARVAIETDGWAFHRTRHAFENDRRRDATLTRAGYRTLRFTHRQIAREPATVAATLAAAVVDRRAA